MALVGSALDTLSLGPSSEETIPKHAAWVKRAAPSCFLRSPKKSGM